MTDVACAFALRLVGAAGDVGCGAGGGGGGVTGGVTGGRGGGVAVLLRLKRVIAASKRG